MLVHVVVAVAADVLPLVYDERAQPQLAARPLRYHSSCNNIQLQFTGKYSDLQRYVGSVKNDVSSFLMISFQLV